jgi:hypothetical protein
MKTLLTENEKNNDFDDNNDINNGINNVDKTMNNNNDNKLINNNHISNGELSGENVSLKSLDEILSKAIHR